MLIRRSRKFKVVIGRLILEMDGQKMVGAASLGSLESGRAVVSYCPAISEGAEVVIGRKLRSINQVRDRQPRRST